MSQVEQGAGEVPVRDGAQVGGKLQETADVGRVVFNLPLHAPYWYFLPRDRAFGSLFSSADGRQYSVLAQAPPPNPLRVGAPKGAVTHLDEYQAYEKQADDASLRITLSDLLLQTIDDNNASVRGSARPRAAATRCAPSCASMPARTPRRRAVTSSTPAESRTWRAISTRGGRAQRRRRTPPGRCGARTTSTSTATPTTAEPARPG